jgi:hypothetical protein
MSIMSDKILLQKLIINEKSKKRLEVELEETQKLVTILEIQLEDSNDKINQLTKEKNNLKKQLKVYEADFHPKPDIGEFISDSESELVDIGKFILKRDISNQFLINRDSKMSKDKINKIIEQLDGKCDASFQYVTNNIFNRKNRRDLIDHINRYYDNNEQDFKLEITSDTLQKLIGNDKLAKIQKVFQNNISKIKLRRVNGNNSYIDFHKDYAKKTLKIPLNSHREYNGGDLIYLTDGEIHVPKQNLNSMTIHDTNIIHGVSAITEGIRYSLFILCN